jgi:hypothetical protein
LEALDAFKGVASEIAEKTWAARDEVHAKNARGRAKIGDQGVGAAAGAELAAEGAWQRDGQRVVARSGVEPDTLDVADHRAVGQRHAGRGPQLCHADADGGGARPHQRDLVIACAAVIGVRTSIAGGVIGEDIIAVAAIEDVEARAALQRVIAGAAVQRVIAFAAEQPVIAGTAVDLVVAGIAKDRLIGGASRHGVGTAEERNFQRLHIEVGDPVEQLAHVDGHPGHRHGPRWRVGEGRGVLKT